MKTLMVVSATAVVTLALAVCAHRAFAADGPMTIPKEGEGYQITRTDSSKKAPSGFEGRTDTSTQTAVGNTPATMGKRVVAHFTLSNQIKTCPAADGAAEGEGVFSLTVDFTDAQAGGSATTHIDMRAQAKYKGQVNDDAYLDGPVKAEIDYTYKQTGTIRGANGALVTSPGSNAAQHVTIQFVVTKDMTPPSVNAFAGGDPTLGHTSEAYAVGTALAYWAGVYYSVAQLQWRGGQCVKISYAPPSNTVQPALGAQVKVKAEVKTKGGERVPAKFFEAHAFQGGNVSPVQGASTETSPLTFTYTAPNTKPSASSIKAAFEVTATSRAGISREPWEASLGTGWSGQISCSYIASGALNSEQISASSYEAKQLTIDVKDGVGTITGYSEVNSRDRSLRPVARQGYEFESSRSTSGIAEGNAPARVEVNVNETTKTYSIGVQYTAFPPGTQHDVSCDRQSGCREQDRPLYVGDCLGGRFGGRPGGTLTNPNELSESKSDVIPGDKGTQTWNVTWHLARRGTTK